MTDNQETAPHPLLKYGVAGWEISGVTTAQSGSTINVTLSGDPANIGISGLQRPNMVGSVPTLNCLARHPWLKNVILR